MERWTEMRTAYAVAEHGTISAAADALGVHRATVVRHIDVLEQALGGRLFQRHGRGYTPTEAGLDMLRVARATETQFTELSGRIRGRSGSVSGELVVTSIALVAPLVLPAVAKFRAQHPGVRVRYEVSSRRFRLEYGEAHLAVRTGARPTEPDNIVQSFAELNSALYAHPSYLERTGPRALQHHDFVLDTSGPLRSWLEEVVPEPSIVFESPNAAVPMQALAHGLGVGFCPSALAPANWVQLHPPQPSWRIPMWLVTHVDLHRTDKVQALLRLLKGPPPDPGADS